MYIKRIEVTEIFIIFQIYLLGFCVVYRTQRKYTCCITTDVHWYFQNKLWINGMHIFNILCGFFSEKCEWNVLVCLHVEYVSNGGGTRGLGHREHLANREEERTIRREWTGGASKHFNHSRERRREGDRGKVRGRQRDTHTRGKRQSDQDEDLKTRRFF